MFRRLLLGAVLALVARPAAAEIHFLAKQYTRCSACHYSDSGGTLLTAYGRSLSREELSTFGATAADDPSPSSEHEALFGFVRKVFGEEGLDLGVTLRPSRLEMDFGRGTVRRDLWMRADLQAAFRHGNWTAYGEVGRFPSEPAEVMSREHWLGWVGDSGDGFKIGRFLPAFGLRHVDHTNLNRRELGFDQDDQLYGVELSHSGDKTLVQFALSPGRAESLLDDDGSASFNAVGRLQRDLSNRKTLVLSGVYRGAADFVPHHAIGSVAYGWAPSEHLSLWTELGTRVMPGWKGTPEYTVVHEAAFEVYRGVWLKYSPQIRTELANVSGGVIRHSFALQLFPRSHWNINVSYIRDHDRRSDLDFKTLILQFHIYL